MLLTWPPDLKVWKYTNDPGIALRVVHNESIHSVVPREDLLWHLDIMSDQAFQALRYSVRDGVFLDSIVSDFLHPNHPPGIPLTELDPWDPDEAYLFVDTLDQWVRTILYLANAGKYLSHQLFYSFLSIITDTMSYAPLCVTGIERFRTYSKLKPLDDVYCWWWRRKRFHFKTTIVCEQGVIGRKKLACALLDNYQEECFIEAAGDKQAIGERGGLHLLNCQACRHMLYQELYSRICKCADIEQQKRYNALLLEGPGNLLL